MRRRDPFHRLRRTDPAGVDGQLAHLERNLNAPVTLHKDVVDTSTVIERDERVHLVGPITVAPNRTLTIQAGGVVRID